MNTKEPLFLPRGSIRALLALIVTGTSMFLFATQTAIPGELLTLNGVVLTYYFVQRNNEANDSPQEDELPEPALADGEDA